MTEYKFSDIRVGDRAAFVKGTNRVEMKVTTAREFSADGDEFFMSEGNGWAVVDIIKPPVEEPQTQGSVVRFTDDDDQELRVAVRMDEDSELLYPWQVSGNDDVWSWSEIQGAAQPGTIEVIA